MRSQILPLPNEKSTVGEESRIGVHAKGNKGDPHRKSQLAFAVGQVDGVEPRNLLVALRFLAIRTLRRDHLAVHKKVHAHGLIAHRQLRIVRHRHSHQDNQLSMMRLNLNMQSKPGERPVMWRMMPPVLPLISRRA